MILIINKCLIMKQVLFKDIEQKLTFCLLINNPLFGGN